MPSSGAAGRATRPLGRLVLGSVLVLTGIWLGVERSAISFVGTQSACQRSSRVALNAVDPKLKNRIKAVKKTAKITDAMRLVAAAKVRKAQEGVKKARPFGDELQGMIKGLVKKLKGSGLENDLPMLKVPEQVKNVAVVIVGSNKGLCGGYNSQVVKRARARVLDLNAQGIVPKLIVVGKKAQQSVRGKFRTTTAEFETVEELEAPPKEPTAEEASKLSEKISSIFLSGEVDKVEIVYAKFLNLVTNEPSVRTILPLSPTGMEDEEDVAFKLTSEDGNFKVKTEKKEKVKAKDIEPDVLFDQPPEVILNSMLPLYLNSLIFSVLYEALASELGSKMTAMKAATDNAEELGKKLTTIYNKKRQAQITAEILEITSGAMATESTQDETELPMGVPGQDDDSAETVFPDLMREIEKGDLPDKRVPSMLSQS